MARSRKRICFVAGYDKDGTIQPYVIHYLNALSELADVYYMADCYMEPMELKKIAPYVKYAKAERHGEYDFGSWKKLLQHVHPDIVEQYDELIITNDSIFAPIQPLAPIFKSFDNARVDFWGMTLNDLPQPHIQSYFVVFKRTVLREGTLFRFLESVKKQDNVDAVVATYEIPLTQVLAKQRFKFGALCEGLPTTTSKHSNPTVHWKTLLLAGNPILKIKVFTETFFSKERIDDWEQVLTTVSNYPPTLVQTHLNHLGVDVSSNGLMKRQFYIIGFIIQREIRRTFRRLFNIKTSDQK